MFGGLLASAIANMQGIRNYSSWRWVFILEGMATIILGVNAYFFVADFPADVHWLDPKEKKIRYCKDGAEVSGSYHDS